MLKYTPFQGMCIRLIIQRVQIGGRRGLPCTDGVRSAVFLVFSWFGVSWATGIGSCLGYSDYGMYCHDRLSVFGACPDGHMGFTCHDDPTCCNRNGIKMAFVIKLCKLADEIRLFWFLEGPSFDPVCLVMAVARSTEMYWTDLTHWIHFSTSVRN